MKKSIGVLAFQGDVAEHATIIAKLGHQFMAVRNKQDLENVDALIIPGGESTTIGFFLKETGLDLEIKSRAMGGEGSRIKERQPLMPVWGTCAGAIVMAKNIKSKIIPPHLGLMDMTIERNAYGRQIDSFYTEIDIPKLKIFGLKTAFIRAPVILNIENKNNLMPRLEILAVHENKIVLVRQGNLLASTFHPELTNDPRLHEYFIGLVL